jgi:hypothetical protein
MFRPSSIIVMPGRQSKKYFGGNKKGSLSEVVTLLVFPIILVTILIGVYVGYRETADAFDNIALEVNETSYTDAAAGFSRDADRFKNFWDPLLVFMFFGLWIGIMVVAYILGNNPIFTFLYVIGAVGMIIASIALFIIMSYVIGDVTLGAYFVDWPITAFFFQHFYIYSILCIVGTGVALYMKPGEQGVGI